MGGDSDSLGQVRGIFLVETMFRSLFNIISIIP